MGAGDRAAVHHGMGQRPEPYRHRFCPQRQCRPGAKAAARSARPCSSCVASPGILRGWEDRLARVARIEGCQGVDVTHWPKKVGYTVEVNLPPPSFDTS